MWPSGSPEGARGGEEPVADSPSAPERVSGRPPTSDQVRAGQAVYTPRTLPIYDLVVLGVSNRFIWSCPTARIVEHYERHLSGNHLDVGVGTGYFMDRCRFPTRSPRVALMDLNDSTLEFASRRIARYRPETYRLNVLEPIGESIDPFDSVAMNYLLHCVPGAIRDKAVAFDHVGRLLKPGAVIFGSTILQGDVHRGWAARALMSVYNRKGIFSNTEDDLDGLRSSLTSRFEAVQVEVAGCVALFSGRARPGDAS
jgi:SAM-dependent methyltransferase